MAIFYRCTFTLALETRTILSVIARHWFWTRFTSVKVLSLREIFSTRTLYFFFTLSSFTFTHRFLERRGGPLRSIYQLALYFYLNVTNYSFNFRLSTYTSYIILYLRCIHCVSYNQRSTNRLFYFFDTVPLIYFSKVSLQFFWRCMNGQYVWPNCAEARSSCRNNS